MDFNDIEQIKNAGFVGFKAMKDLFADSSTIPKIKGVYLVLNPTNKVEFLTVGTCGHFKGENPNVSIAKLQENWIEKTIVLYIGKAGKAGSAVTLQSRLKQYFGNGQGKNGGHRGGRFIWQLKHSYDLVVCWKELPIEDPRTVEADLIRDFVSKFSNLPFANLKR